ncbi:MAG: Hydrolase, HAD superfamily [uncultured Acidimicrobiales bacterium]|uniref:Hydrolase, HAD superfamily n=1 Tax=uncultured Acidimicrobiales bacterium TaxID=310071 RepID=A0A6J4IF24_9ACTN|nr:MAG: Hydrolase, HAD superfamily [uncultured Acidimicrobiales bacterium]
MTTTGGTPAFGPLRLVATDLDGTIVRSDGTVSDRTRAAFAAAEEAGVGVVLVTGRPPRWMHTMADETGHRGLAILSNGAIVYDLHEERIVEEHPLDPAAAAEVVAALRRAIPGLVFAVERGGRFGHEPAWIPRYAVPDDVLVGELDDLLAEPMVKLLARHDELSGDEMVARARAVVGGVATVTHSGVGSTGMLEVSGPDVTKASALARLAANLGTGPEGTVAFGDMPNDLPMLAWAGHSVAVANAHAEVRAMADEVTGSNDDDGVAMVVERLLAEAV